jgi:hypothetical protein
MRREDLIRSNPDDVSVGVDRTEGTAGQKWDAPGKT